MPTAEISFGALFPDQPTYKAPGLVRAENAYPSPGGYGSFHQPILSEDVVSGAMISGAARFLDAGGSYVYVAGTTDGDLIVSRGGSSSITPTGVALPSGAAWSFAQFNNFCIAAAPGRPPHYLPSLSGSGTWIVLPGNPPNSAVVGRLGEHLVFGDTQAGPATVAWSAFNDPTAPYVTDALRQSDSFTFPQEYGRVTAIVAEPFPMVFQERAVWNFRPTGGASVFTRLPAAREVGAIASGSAVSIGQQVAFLSRDGFYLTDGSGLQPIGTSRVNETFFDTADGSRLSEVHGVADWTNESIVWAFTTKGGAGFDKLLIYSFSQQRWSTAVQSVQYLTEAANAALTAADLDTLYGASDNVPFTMDAAVFKTRGDTLGAWVSSGDDAVFAAFTGNAAEATFETGYFQPKVGGLSFVTGLRPLIENTDRSSQAAIITAGPVPGAGRLVSDHSLQELDGFCPQFAESAFLAASVKVPAGSVWRAAQGVQVRFEPAGDGD